MMKLRPTLLALALVAPISLLAMADAPDKVEVRIIESSLDPVDAYEVAIPSVAPALANAIHAATTVRIRKLPLLPELMRML